MVISIDMFHAIFQMLMGFHRDDVDGDDPAEIPIAQDARPALLRPATRPADSDDAHRSTTVPLNVHGLLVLVVLEPSDRAIQSAAEKPTACKTEQN